MATLEVDQHLANYITFHITITCRYCANTTPTITELRLNKNKIPEFHVVIPETWIHDDYGPPRCGAEECPGSSIER